MQENFDNNGQNYRLLNVSTGVQPGIFEGRGGFYKFKFKMMFAFSIFDWKCRLIKGIPSQK